MCCDFVYMLETHRPEQIPHKYCVEYFFSFFSSIWLNFKGRLNIANRVASTKTLSGPIKLFTKHNRCFRVEEKLSGRKGTADNQIFMIIIACLPLCFRFSPVLVGGKVVREKFTDFRISPTSLITFFLFLLILIL